MRGFLETGGRNDCEASCARIFLRWLKRWIGLRGMRLRGSQGTGSCVFAKFADPKLAERIAARVPDTWRAWVVRGLDSSPLLEELGRCSNS
jgi:4-diphosphocytidyl-2-C-methyl-D-erythritol kinase